MRDRLAQSLRYIIEAIGGRISFDAAALAPVPSWIESGPVPPLIFGAYADLVMALEAGDIQQAQLLLDELAQGPASDGGLRVRDLADPLVDAHAARYQRRIDTDPGTRVPLRPPPAAEAAACRRLIEQAFALLDGGHPALAAELRALLREIVLATAPEEPGALVFDGASSFMLWGAIVLNVKRQTTVLDMVQALAHESGHNLLFGLCVDGPLADNGSAERYPSPLRSDPRPMDGILHATYVSARMHHTLAHLLAAGVLAADDAVVAQRELVAHARHFDHGMQTVARHARLTATGTSILDGAASYMRSAT